MSVGLSVLYNLLCEYDSNVLILDNTTISFTNLDPRRYVVGVNTVIVNHLVSGKNNIVKMGCHMGCRPKLVLTKGPQYPWEPSYIYVYIFHVQCLFLLHFSRRVMSSLIICCANKKDGFIMMSSFLD